MLIVSEIELGQTWSNQAGSFMATGELWQVVWEEPGGTSPPPPPRGRTQGGTKAAALERPVPWVVTTLPVSQKNNTYIYCTVIEMESNVIVT